MSRKSNAVTSLGIDVVERDLVGGGSEFAVKVWTSGVAVGVAVVKVSGSAYARSERDAVAEALVDLANNVSESRVYNKAGSPKDFGATTAIVKYVPPAISDRPKSINGSAGFDLLGPDAFSDMP